MTAYCENCGCEVYNGHCVNCHEEISIYEQSQQNDEQTEFSSEFMNKVKDQYKTERKCHG